MIVRKLRLQRGWSQEELAKMTSLSVRTIQRIERGHKPGLESLKSLASVFEIDISQLQEETEMPIPTETVHNDIHLTMEERQAMEYVKEVKGFYSHAISYAIVIPILCIINLFNSPDYFWAMWPMLGWGIGLVAHGLVTFEVFNFLGADWERKQVEKRLGRKL